MKRFALAGLAALALTLAAQQQASAGGFSIGGNVSFSLSCNWWCGCGPCGYGCCNPCTYYGCGYGGYYPGFNYGGGPYDYGYGYPAATYAPAYAMQGYYAPPSQPAAAAYAAQATTVPVGYYPYSYGSGYGYQAPNYWYGR